MLAKMRRWKCKLLESWKPMMQYTAPKPSFCVVYLQSHSIAARDERSDEESVCKVNISSDIASSFRDWFSKGRPSHFQIARNVRAQGDVDRICKVLAQGYEGAQTEEALTLLKVKLTEQCVISVIMIQTDAVPALKFFDWAARQRGFFHTVPTYYALLRKLSGAKSSGIMLDWLDSFLKQDNKAKGTVFYGALIIGYAVARMPDEALRVYTGMRFKGLDFDKFTYKLLLSSLVQESCFDVANVVYEQMFHAGFCDYDTSCLIIKCLLKQNKLDEAKRLFDQLQQIKELINADVVNKLVKELCKKERLEEASELVEKVNFYKEEDLAKVYEGWIIALVEAKRVNAAFEFFRRKSSIGYIPSHRCYNSLASGLLRRYMLEEGFDLLIEMKEKHVVPDDTTVNIAICLFSRGGLFDVALDLFNSKDISLDHVTCVEVISALCRCHRVEEAYEVLQNALARGFFLDKFTCTILADELCNAHKLSHTLELVNAGANRGSIPAVATCRRFIAALCMAGRMNDAYTLLNKLRKHNIILDEGIFSHLVYSFCKANNPQKASRVLLEMLDYGHTPHLELLKIVIKSFGEADISDWVISFLNMHTRVRSATVNFYNAFITALCYAGQLDIALQVFDWMHHNGCEPNLKSHVILLRGLLRCKRVSDASRFLDAAVPGCCQSTRLFNVMIRDLCLTNNTNFAHLLLQEMSKRGLTPSLLCYEKLIYALCNKGDFVLALRMYNDMKIKGRPASAFIYTTLISHCFKLYEIEQAWHILDSICKQKSRAYFRTLPMFIKRLSEAQHLEFSLQRLETLIECSFGPSIVAYNTLLRSLCQAGKLEMASDVFSRFTNNGCIPNMWTYNILVLGFCKAGRLLDAKRKLNEMAERGFQPSKSTWKLFTVLMNESAQKNL